MKIMKNDIVKIISGNFKGKIGKVIFVFKKEKKIQIENIGFYKKHIKSRVYRKYPEGGIIEKLKVIDISNIMFYSKKLSRPVRLGYTQNKDKKKIRIYKGRGIPCSIINEIK
jgi:large subunit ribosomal protein L24